MWEPNLGEVGLLHYIRVLIKEHGHDVSSNRL